MTFNEPLDNENEPRWDSFPEQEFTNDHNVTGIDNRVTSEFAKNIGEAMLNIENALAEIRQELSFVNCKHRCSVTVDNDGVRGDSQFGYVGCDNCDVEVSHKQETCKHDYPLRDFHSYYDPDHEEIFKVCSNCGMMKHKRKWKTLEDIVC